MCRGIGACDREYKEYKKLCRKAWSEKLNYLYIDMTRDKKECKYRMFNQSKTTFFECIPKSEVF